MKEYKTKNMNLQLFAPEQEDNNEPYGYYNIYVDGVLTNSISASSERTKLWYSYENGVLAVEVSTSPVENNFNLLNNIGAVNSSYTTNNIQYELSDTEDDEYLSVLSENVEYPIYFTSSHLSTLSLTNCTCNKTNETGLSGSYSATITANEGYYLNSVISTLGTATIAENKKSAIISIADVTESFTITAVGVAITNKEIQMHPKLGGVLDYTVNLYPKTISDVLKENISNKVTTLTSASTNTQYPSAKVVYDAIEDVRETAEGKTASYVCSDSTNASLNSQNDLVEISSFIDSNGVTIEPSDLSIGDVLYITEIDVPDRWVSYLQSESATLLPSEYQELTYLQGDGNNFIDTGVVTTANTGSETTFELSSLSQQVLFGGRNGTTTNTFTAFFLSSNNKFRIDFNEQDNLDVVLSADTQYTLKITNNGSYYTASLGETSFTKAIPSTVPTSSQYLFALHDVSSVTQYSTAKIYRHKLYETSTLSHDFVPCYRKADNITGVYDLITSTFIPESGNGALVRGSNKSYGSIIRLNKLETAKVPITSISVNNSAVSPSNGNVSLSVPTITLNGSSSSTPSFYAPTSAGTSGQVLISAGSGTPTWTTLTVNPTQDLTSNTAGTLDATAWGNLKSSHTATISSPTMTGLSTDYEFITIKLSINSTNQYVKLTKNTTSKYSGMFYIEESTNLYEIGVYYNGTNIILRCATVY